MLRSNDGCARLVRISEASPLWIRRALVYVAATLLALSCASPVPPAVTSVRPSSDGSPSATEQRLADYWWYSIAVKREHPQPAGAPDLIDGFVLTLGHLDKARPLVEVIRPFELLEPPADYLAAEPFARVAGRDHLVYGYFDGRQSQVHRVTASDGRDEIVYRTDAPIHSAALDPASDVIFFVALESDSRREDGIWRVERASDEPPSRIVPPSGGDPRREGWLEDLWLTPSRNALVARDCNGTSCRIRVFDPTTGSLISQSRRAEAGDVFGVTDTELLYDSFCRRPCPIAAYGLGTGRVREVGQMCQTAAMVETAAGPALIYQASGLICTAEGDPYRLEAQLLAGGPAIRVYESKVSNPGLVPLGTDIGGTLPPGWFMIGADNTFLGRQPAGYPALVEIASGRQIALFTE
jgi:hypothetical protein